MTQNSSDMKRLAELNSLFLTLNSKDQDIALIILRSLKFSQSVMSSPDRPNTPVNHLRTVSLNSSCSQVSLCEQFSHNIHTIHIVFPVIQSCIILIEIKIIKEGKNGGLE